MKHMLIGTVAAVALLTACGGGGDDAPSSSSDSVQVGGVKLPGLKLVAGDADKAADALTALSLNESGAGRVNFADSKTNGADATFSDVTIGIDDAPNAITSGSLVFKGLNMTDAGASFSQMTLTDMVVTPDDADDGTVNISSIQLTNPSPELAAWVSSLMGQGEPADFPGFDKISFDGFNMSGLDLIAEGVDELDVFKIGAIDIRQFSASGIGSVLFDGIDLQGNDDGQAINMSLGSMGMTGLNEVLMGAFVAGFAGGVGGDPEDLAEEMFALIGAKPGDPGYDSFTIDNFLADVSGIKVDMPSMDAVVSRDKQGRATRSVTKPFKLSVTAAPEGEAGSQLAGPLALMGYETLNFSGASDVSMNPDDDSMNMQAKGNYFALEDGFKLSSGASISGVSKYYTKLSEGGPAAAEDPEFMLEALGEMSLNGLEISFEDNSIIDKGFTMAGAMSGQDAKGMRDQAIAGVAFLPLMAGQAGVDPAIAAEIGGALSSFLNESGTLTLKLSPNAPLTANDFTDPSALTKDRLGFSATTK